MIKLNYYWRVFATGFCFLMFSIGALCLSTLVFPMQKVFIKEELRRRNSARYTVHKSFKFFVDLMCRVGVLKTEVTGLERLHNAQGMVIVANHPSLIDVVVLIACMPNVDCVVKSTLFKNRFLKGVFSSTGYISNDNPEQLIKDCQESLKLGNNIIIFPEGTRTVPGKPLKFMRGAANIAVRCKADYLPVFITVNPTTLTKSDAWYTVPPLKKVTLTLHALAPMDLSKYWHGDSNTLSARALTRDSEIFYMKELEQYEY